MYCCLYCVCVCCDRNAGVGDGWVVVSAGHVAGTGGSCIVSSTVDVLWMSVVRGMRGVGGVCDCEMCMCLAVRGLALGFTNPVGTWGVLDVCLGCYVCVRCESGFSV